MMFLWRAAFALLIVETLVFFAVVGKIGFFDTFLLWCLSALVGGYLVRAQGMATLGKLMAGGRVQAEQMYDSFCLLLAGFLFVFPGFVSDLIAFALLIPVLRHSFREQGLKFFRFDAAPAPREEDGVIEGRYEVVDEAPAEINDLRKP